MKRILVTLAAVALMLTSCDKIENQISDLDQRLQKIEEVIIPAIEARIIALETAIGVLEANGATDEDITALEEEISKLKEYINEQLNGAEEARQEINDKIATLESRLNNIENSATQLISRIQSVSYIPTHSDGKATMSIVKCLPSGFLSKGAILDFEISPKSAVVELAKVWESALSAKVVYTATRAAEFVNLPITSFSSNEVNGTISVSISGENLSEEFAAGTQEASVVLAISDGNTSILSEYIPLTTEVNAEYVLSTNTYRVDSSKGLYTWKEAVITAFNKGESSHPNLTLTADITLTGENNWAILGDKNPSKLNFSYRGTINGSNKTIRGLHMVSTTDATCFMSSLEKGSTIKNLTFANVNMTGKATSGIIVGVNYGTIENCHTTADSNLTCTDGEAGGLVGYNGNSGKIIGCTNAATILGTSQRHSSGGIAAQCVMGQVIGCFNTGSVTSNNYSAGGIVGSSDRSETVACGNTATVLGVTNVGGIVGACLGSTGNYAEIIGSWTVETTELANRSSVETTNKDGIGDDSRYHVATNCFSFTDVTTANNSISKMNSAIRDYGWEWIAGANDGYPTLRKNQ